MNKFWALTKAILIIIASMIGCFVLIILLGIVLRALAWAFLLGYNLF